MAKPLDVDDAIKRFDELIARYEGGTPEQARARRRHYGRSAKAVGRRVANMGLALLLLAAATIGFGLLVGPIGLGGLFLVLVLTLLILIFFAVWPGEPERVSYSEQVPTQQLVRQLDSFLVRQRPALPRPAAQRIDAISAQLPLLEARLEQSDTLDPLAQDARRLMGKHLPELIERYERVPPAFRHEKDGAGLTADERLVSALDTARQALDDIGAKLARGDLDALETHGRFIESRYKDPDGFKQD